MGKEGQTKSNPTIGGADCQTLGYFSSVPDLLGFAPRICSPNLFFDSRLGPKEERLEEVGHCLVLPPGWRWLD
jgi:hypothetical protein